MASEYRDWRGFWWAIFRHFGKECRKTWGGEVIAVIVGGVAGAGTSYLRSHGQTSFTDALIDGLITSALFFGLYVSVHLLRSPWLERKGEGDSPTAIDGLIGTLIFFLLLAGVGLVLYLAGTDMRSEIVLHAPAEVGGKRSTDLIDLKNCKSNYAALMKPGFRESSGSLRKKTSRLVMDLNEFWSRRPQPPQLVQNPSTEEERKRNAAWDQYWRDAKAAYLEADYRNRLVEIVRQYKAKGVDTGNMEQAFDQPERLVGSSPFGGWELDNCMFYMNELCQLRELSFHVDARDQRIEPSF